MDDNTNNQKVDSLDSLEFSLDDNDLDALRNYKSAPSNKVDNSSNFEVTDMEISWEDSLEALRQERAKLSQQVLQHEPVEAVPLIFEQAVQEAIQEQVIEEDIFAEIEPTTKETAIILHDEPLFSMLDEIGLVKGEGYDSEVIEFSSVHMDSVSFKGLQPQSNKVSESESNLDHVDYLDEKKSGLIDFEKIKQEALARAQNKPFIGKGKEVVRMVNPDINFNIQKNDGQADHSAIRPKEKPSTGSFNAEIAMADNMVKPHTLLTQEISETNVEESIETASIAIDLGKENGVLSSQMEEKLESEVPQAAPTEEIHIEPLQAATLRRSYEQGQVGQSKVFSTSQADPMKRMTTSVQEQVGKENIPELNLAVPEKQTAYGEVAAEVITQEPVSLVGETQLVDAILVDLQPHLEKIIASCVHEEVVTQTVILVKNVSTNLEKKLPNLLSEALSVQIKKAMQRVKNPLQK